MRTEIFHPNMNLSEISLGEERGWSASQPLIDIVKRIGRMISYQEYSLNAPLNKEAAKWAKKNASALPLNSADFFAPDETTPEASKALEGAAGEKAFCAYCQDVDPKNICDSGHAVCGDCLSHCRYCDHATCLACSGNTCRTCAQQISADRSEIAAAFERGDIGQVDALVRNALNRFPDSLELMESLDKAKRVKRTLSHIKGFKKAKCFHAIVTAHEELRSMGFDHEILSKVAKKAAERLNAANAAVEKGKNELQTNRCPKRASQYFSHALRIVSDHPSAYKLLQEAKTRMVKAHGKMESAKQWFDKDQHDAAIREATKALALDSTLRPEAQELIETASHLQTSQTRKKHKRLLLVCMTLATVLIAAVIRLHITCSWHNWRKKLPQRTKSRHWSITLVPIKGRVVREMLKGALTISMRLFRNVSLKLPSAMRALCWQERTTKRPKLSTRSIFLGTLIRLLPPSFTATLAISAT
jgi:tetratricopeptide (TPR) repeat protein